MAFEHWLTEAQVMFGKYAGKKWSEVPTPYLKWLAVQKTERRGVRGSKWPRRHAERATKELLDRHL